MKIILIVSLFLGILAAILAPMAASLHVYEVKSGLSGKVYRMEFSELPSEEDFLDAMIYREIEPPYEIKQDWRKARSDGVKLRMKMDANKSLLVMPYEPSSSPDMLYPDGGLTKGVWLTEPSTRKKYPVILVGALWSVGSFIVWSVGCFCFLSALNFTVRFILRLGLKCSRNAIKILLPQELFSSAQRMEPNPEPEPKDPYTVLGVHKNNNFDEIRSAYRQRMKEYHPDRVAGLGAEFRQLAEKKTKEINSAFEFLKKNYNES